MDNVALIALLSDLRRWNALYDTSCALYLLSLTCSDLMREIEVCSGLHAGLLLTCLKSEAAKGLRLAPTYLGTTAITTGHMRLYQSRSANYASHIASHRAAAVASEHALACTGAKYPLKRKLQMQLVIKSPTT